MLFDARYPVFVPDRVSYADTVNQQTERIWSSGNFEALSELANRIKQHSKTIDSDHRIPASFKPYMIDRDGYLTLRIGGNHALRTRAQRSSLKSVRVHRPPRAPAKRSRAPPGNALVESLSGPPTKNLTSASLGSLLRQAMRMAEKKLQCHDSTATRANTTALRPLHRIVLQTVLGPGLWQSQRLPSKEQQASPIPSMRARAAAPAGETPTSGVVTH